jgi:hypothetical protein
MNPTTFFSRLAAATVAGVAGFASYRHIFDVASKAGEHQGVAAVLPLAIDGLIVVGTLALLEDKRHNRAPRLSARVALVFGVLATIAANIASAHPSVTARLVAAVPAVSFLIAVEVLSRTGKRRTVEPVAEPTPEPTPEPVAEVTPEPMPEPTPAPRRAPAQRVTARSLTSADRVKAAHLAEPAATHVRLAELSGVSLATVKRYRPRETGSPNVPDAAETRINGAATELVEVTR